MSNVSIVLQATQIALRTHQTEKRMALRNAVMNAALPQAPEEGLQQMFLHFIDTFTEWHLRLLSGSVILGAIGLVLPSGGDRS